MGEGRVRTQGGNEGPRVGAREGDGRTGKGRGEGRWAGVMSKEGVGSSVGGKG